MRKMLLSFKPAIYDKIHEGIKIYEHRRNFPDEPILAYMYVSKPIKAITGIVILKHRHLLDDWEKEYAYDTEALARISQYKEHYRYAMEISEFRETNSISLADVQKKINGFKAPQSYYYLENNKMLLSLIEGSIVETDYKITHDFSDISSEIICVH